MTVEPPRRTLWDKLIESPGFTWPILAALCWTVLALILWALFWAAEAISEMWS